ncbi:cytosolic phospholipase A2 gamma-like [Carassius auratus]|uniref:Cytosolic phospholipase A2 gamma-like n=1 Tax=Carassius auratus TaxID=7957 RepID=A0A6P6NS30_CARAU|nr:cytosolic phospholipase A2 gamma-like [Carassius auratus]
MSAFNLQESEVRIKHSLNKDEEDFIVNRRKSIFTTVENLETHCSEDEVPNIALLGSGGGQRAMVGLLGSLVQLDKSGLLDCILYLSGVSGSAWCMASLYQEPDWSTKLDTVKDKIIRRLSGPGVSFTDKLAKLKKYYYEKDHFSLTDVWAVMVVTKYIKEIDEHTVSHQHDQHKKDPFPIYTVIDKQCKQCEERDPWFEISRLEAGYSLTGAFVETSSFGSKFDKGSKKNPQDEMDMLYLQALCGSALADGEEMVKFMWKQIKDFFDHLFPQIKTILEEMGKDPNDPPAEKYFQVLMDLVNMNLSVLNVIDPSDYDKSIRKKIEELAEGKRQLIFPEGKLDLTNKEAAKLYMERYTMDVCNYLSDWFSFWPFDACFSICRCMVQWIWGREYNFFHNVADEAVPPVLLEGETRDYMDAGVLLNSPYFSVLREERNIDLIISLDFSDGNPFMTLKQTADMCKKQKIPFPDVPMFSEKEKKYPNDFYVFKGTNTPTVIHIPLFNVFSCEGKLSTWRQKYRTFQCPYSAEMITGLMEVAGKNISNNRKKLLNLFRKNPVTYTT